MASLIFLLYTHCTFDRVLEHRHTFLFQKDNDKQENIHSVQTKQTQPETFCGFKTGFLLPKTKTGKSTTMEKNSDSKARDSSNVSEPDIPFIKPRIQSPKESEFSIPEVQQAMDASRALFENKGTY